MNKTGKRLLLMATALCAALCLAVCALADAPYTPAGYYGTRNTVEIIDQPMDVVITGNTNVWFSVSARGDNLSYQWMCRTPDGPWRQMNTSDSDTDQIRIAATSATAGYQYRCVITDDYGNKVISDTATVQWNTYSRLKITSQPLNAGGREGSKVTFTVDANGDGLYYQWQEKTPRGNWNNTFYTGYNTANLTVQVTAARNGCQYRCRIMDRYGDSVVSDAAALSLNSSLRILSQPQNASVRAGTGVTFTVEAEGDNLSYQWQMKSTGSGWVNMGAASARNTFTVFADDTMNGYQYRCRVTDPYGNSEVSDAATLTLAADTIRILLQPEDQTAGPGDYVVFTARAAGDGITYQWQRKIPGGKWANRGSASSQEILRVSVDEYSDGYQYRCEIRDRYGNSVLTDVATLYVNAALQIVTQPRDQTAYPGETAVFALTASGNGLTYQWQYRASASGNWKNSPADGADTAQLNVSVTDQKNGYQYRCLVTDRTGTGVLSDTVTLTVPGTSGPVIVLQPVNAEVKTGDVAVFEVDADGDGLSFQWQELGTDGAWRSAPYGGNRSRILTVPVSGSENGSCFRCMVTDVRGNQVISDPVVLTVKKQKQKQTAAPTAAPTKAPSKPSSSLTVTMQPSDVKASANTVVKFTVKAGGGNGLTYEWQCAAPGGGWMSTSAKGFLTKTLEIPASRELNGYQFRCVITSGNGDQVFSDPAVLTVR